MSGNNSYDSDLSAVLEKTTLFAVYCSREDGKPLTLCSSFKPILYRSILSSSKDLLSRIRRLKNLPLFTFFYSTLWWGHWTACNCDLQSSQHWHLSFFTIIFSISDIWPSSLCHLWMFTSECALQEDYLKFHWHIDDLNLCSSWISHPKLEILLSSWFEKLAIYVIFFYSIFNAVSERHQELLGDDLYEILLCLDDEILHFSMAFPSVPPNRWLFIVYELIQLIFIGEAPNRTFSWDSFDAWYCIFWT